MNSIEKLRHCDWSKTGVIVSEFRFFVGGDRITRFIEPFGGSQSERAAGFKLIRSKRKNAVLELSGVADEREEQLRRTGNAFAQIHASCDSGRLALQSLWLFRARPLKSIRTL